MNRRLAVAWIVLLIGAGFVVAGVAVLFGLGLGLVAAGVALGLIGLIAVDVDAKDEKRG